MKTDTKRYERASKDVAERVKRLLAEIRPTIQTKHGLDDATLDLAIANGAALALVEYSKAGGVLDAAMEIEGYQQSGQPAGAR